MYRLVLTKSSVTNMIAATVTDDVINGKLVTGYFESLKEF